MRKSQRCCTSNLSLSISYFSGLCDRTPDTGNLREDRLIWTDSLRGLSCHGGKGRTVGSSVSVGKRGFLCGSIRKQSLA